MKAQNLTISVPYKGCDKNCPYCISRITWSPKVDNEMMFRNAEKVFELAKNANVTNILFTGKGEPMLNSDFLMAFTRFFRDRFPMELQTNGLHLMEMYRNAQSDEPFRHLKAWGLDVIAFSIDSIKQLEVYEPMFAAIADLGMIVRVCVNLTHRIGYDFADVMEPIQKVGNVRQVLIRNITYPKKKQWAQKTLPKEVQWIDENTDQAAYRQMAQRFMTAMEAGNRMIRVLPETGVRVYDFLGFSVCFSDYCIQEENRMEDIRSLIYHQDGHVYTSWDSPASLLF